MQVCRGHSCWPAQKRRFQRCGLPTTLLRQLSSNSSTETLADGMDKGSALRKAKLDLMKKFGDQAMPFYWAGFVLDGESASPLFSRQ